MKNFDIVINGGGLIGASAALALNQRGFHVGLIESNPPSPSLITPNWDSRIFAISPINQSFLKSLHVWPNKRITPVKTINILGEKPLSFEAKEADMEALAWIVEQSNLLSLLWKNLRASSITLFTQATPQDLCIKSNRALLTLETGEVLSAKLLIGADGGNSWVREKSAIPYTLCSYGQSAVVANFTCEKPHHHVARQWFFENSIMAWLPLPQKRLSMVWSTPHPEVLVGLSNTELAEQVAKSAHQALGNLTTITNAQAFPLQSIQLSSCIAERVLLMGDAAHLIHPLAGQGVNLGFQDVQYFVRSLKEGKDPGDLENLRSFSMQRLLPVKTMHYGCDMLLFLFNSPSSSCWKPLRNALLRCVSHSRFLRRCLIKFATHDTNS